MEHLGIATYFCPACKAVFHTQGKLPNINEKHSCGCYARLKRYEPLCNKKAAPFSR